MPNTLGGTTSNRDGRVMRTWSALAFAEVVGFLGATYMRFGSLPLSGDAGGGPSRMLLAGYALISIAAIIAACWILGNRRPARFVITASIAVGAFSVVGITAMSLFLFSPVFANLPATASLVFTWALFIVFSLGTASIVLRLAARAWHETPAQAGGASA